MNKKEIKKEIAFLENHIKNTNEWTWRDVLTLNLLKRKLTP